MKKKDDGKGSGNISFLYQQAETESTLWMERFTVDKQNSYCFVSEKAVSHLWVELSMVVLLTSFRIMIFIYWLFQNGKKYQLNLQFRKELLGVAHKRRQNYYYNPLSSTSFMNVLNRRFQTFSYHLVLFWDCETLHLPKTSQQKIHNDILKTIGVFAKKCVFDLNLKISWPLHR